MAYNNAIPAANDLISQSQSDIQQNFAAIQTLIEVNHGTFGAATEGKHKFTSLVEQGAAPVTAANEIALYTKEIGGISALFLRHESAGTEVDITTAVKASPGTCTLPCGIILKWGTGSVSSGQQTSGVVTFSTAFPTAALSVVITASNDPSGYSSDNIINAITLTTASFYARRASDHKNTALTFYYIAIGY